MDTKQLSTKDSITKLEEYLNAMPDKLSEHDFETQHYFTTGLYARETKFLRGSLVIGKIHREDHLLILLQGECLVASEEGTRLLKAPYCGVAKKGIQRAGMAKSDCTFITVHATNETDLKQLEHKLIAPNYKALEVL